MAGLSAIAIASIGVLSPSGAFSLESFDSVCVDAFRGAINDSLEIVLERDRLEVGIQVLGRKIAQIAGVLGVVVSTDSPRQVVLSDVSRYQLHRVVWICLARLPGGC